MAGFTESDDVSVMDPALNLESIFIVVIFMIAMLVFLVMLIAICITFGSENQAGKETMPEEERRLDHRAKIIVSAIFHKMHMRTSRRDDQGRPMHDEPPETRMVRSAEPTRLNTKQNGVPSIALLGIVFSLLLLTEFALRSALHRGWTTYAGSESVSLLAVDNQDQIWAAVPGSIIRFSDDGQSVRMPLPGELANDSVLSLTVDREGRIWLGTVNRMLALRRIDTQWIIYVPEHLEAPIIGSDMVIDAQGQAWTNSSQEHGTELARIELHPESRTYTLANAGLGLIDTLAVDAQGQLWVLSTNGELKTLDPAGSWRTLGTASKQDPDVTWAFSPFGNARLAIDRQGQAWIGVGNGVVHVLVLDGTWQTYSPDKSHSTIYTKGITIDSQGYMWGVVGGQGLYRFHPQMGWTAYNPSNSGLTATYSVTTLVTDGQGRVCIGASDGGLVRFDPAAALQAESVPPLSLLSVTILPAALLSIGLVIIRMIAFPRSATLTGQNMRKSWTVAVGTLGAALCGIYALEQRDIFVERFMQALFGEVFAFG